MPSKTRETSGNQGKLLDHRDHDGLPIIKLGESFTETPKEQPAEPDEPLRDLAVDSEVSVNIISRAEALKAVAETLNERNLKAGLSQVAFKEEIKLRYGEDKGEEAKKRAKELLKEAKDYFWEAYGYEALKTAGIVSPEDLELDLSFDELEEVNFKGLDADVRLLWKEFQDEYAQPGDKAEKKRKKFINQLEEIIKSAQG